MRALATAEDGAAASKPCQREAGKVLAHERKLALAAVRARARPPRPRTRASTRTSRSRRTPSPRVAVAADFAARCGAALASASAQSPAERAVASRLLSKFEAQFRGEKT